MPPKPKTIRTRLKDFTNWLVLQGQLATWRMRVLPGLIIIGAQKSGTTSLFYYLSQHPQLLPSSVKEVHYFDGGIAAGQDSFAKGEAWYRTHFPLRWNVRPGQMTFEASPLYLFHPLAPKRILDLVPQTKMVAILRNPTDRAISHYFHVKRRNLDPLPIQEAMRTEEQRVEPALRAGAYTSSEFLRFTYKSRGRYKEQLERYYQLLPREQILVLSSEEFFREPASTLSQIYNFVGVDAGFKIKDLTPQNTARNKDKVDAGVYDYLDDYFRPHNHALYELLGKDFGWG